MNFSELSQIVKYLKKTLPCNHCQSSYDPQDIEVLSTFDEQGLFSLNCPKCQNQLLVHITINDGETSIQESASPENPQTRRHRPVKAKGENNHHAISSQIISSNDVIDMHCFLGEFNGDFKQLFSGRK
jgi:hypothetical protein